MVIWWYGDDSFFLFSAAAGLCLVTRWSEINQLVKEGLLAPGEAEAIWDGLPKVANSISAAGGPKTDKGTLIDLQGFLEFDRKVRGESGGRAGEGGGGRRAQQAGSWAKQHRWAPLASPISTQLLISPPVLALASVAQYAGFFFLSVHIACSGSGVLTWR